MDTSTDRTTAIPTARQVTPARLIAVAIATLAIVGSAVACTTGKPADTPMPRSTPASTPAPTATSAPAANQGADNGIPLVAAEAQDLLLLYRADDSGYDIVSPENGSIAFSIPDGVMSADHQQIYSARPLGASTTVDAARTEGGELIRQISLGGSWALPRIGMERQLAGLSADGSTLVLVETDAAKDAAHTRFAVVPTNGGQKPKVIDLKGHFEYDAISADGRLVYVLEHFADGDPARYDVRQLDVRTGRLAEGRVVDKRNIDEVMAGYAVTQVAGPQGWYYTVYRRNDGAFIHALSTADGVAFCIDLPFGAEDEATAASWGLALETNGSGLYAANARLGMAVEIDLNEFTIRKSGRLASLTPLITLAKFESATWVEGSAASLGPDGKLLFVAGNKGVIAVRTKDLSTATVLGQSTRFTDVAVGGSGAVYALTDTGSVVQLDSRGGNRAVTIAANRYSGITAVLTMH
jgi:hypothetical protein